MLYPRRNRNARSRRLLLLAALFSLSLCFSGNAAQKIQLILRNGDRLSGTIIEENASRVTLTNEVVGRVQIPVSQIERRESVGITAVAPAPPRAVPNTNAPTGLLLPRTTPEQGKRFEELAGLFMTERISAAEFEKRRAAIFGPARTPSPKIWTGEILAGVDLGYGSKTRQNVSGRFKLNYTDKRLRNALDNIFTYGRTEGELAANRLDANDKVDYDLTRRYYLYALGGTGYDQIRKIDYYIQAGPGLGRHLVQRTNFVFNAEVGANYQLQNFEQKRPEPGQPRQAPDTDLFYYRLAEDLKWTVSSKITFDEKVEYTPQWDDLGQFKLRAEANLRYWLLNNLSLNLTVIDLYDTRVATGVDENDLQIRSSLGVKF